MAKNKRPEPRTGGLPLAAVLAAAFGLLLFSGASANFTWQAWRFTKPILLPPGLERETLVEVVPDREVYAYAAPGLADLRILEKPVPSQVPYKLLVERREQRRGSVAVTVRDLGHVPGQYTTFVLDLNQEGALHNELEVLTPSQNFQRRVTVEASADGKTWALVQEKGRILDFTIRERGLNERYTWVRYPPSTARYLRVRIINDGEPPLEVSGAAVYFAQELPARETELPLSITRREEDAKEKKTVVFLDVGSHGIPTGRIAITTSQENFYRQAHLEGSNDGNSWSPLQGLGVLYAYNTPKFLGSKLSIDYPESTYRYFRLTILNEDNPPLPLAAATAYGVVRKLIFSARPGSSYQLYYGNLDARAPSYELERVFPYLVTENLPEARLGAHVVNPLFAEPSKPFTERYPWLLSTVVAVAGLVIGVFLASLFRQVRRLLPPPSAQ